MYYLKLIFYIVFLLIIINISVGKKCKCLNNGKEKEKLFKRRHKRGNSWCNCLGGEGNMDEYQGLMEEHQQGHFEGEEGDIPESSSRTSKKRALYICDNFYYSHVQLHVKFLKSKFFKIFACVAGKGFDIKRDINRLKDEKFDGKGERFHGRSRVSDRVLENFSGHVLVWKKTEFQVILGKNPFLEEISFLDSAINYFFQT